MQAVEGLSLRGIWGVERSEGFVGRHGFGRSARRRSGRAHRQGARPWGGEGKCHLSAARGVKAGRGVRGVAAPRAAPSRCPDFSGAHERSFGSARARPGFRPERRRKGAQARAAAKPLTPAPPAGAGDALRPRGPAQTLGAAQPPPQKISPCGKSRRDLISNNLCISPRQTCRLSRTCRIFRICQPSQTSRLCPRRTPLALRLHRHARVPLP